MKTTAVLFTWFVSCQGFAQTAITKEDIAQALSFVRRLHEKDFNRSVSPIYTTRSISKIRDSLGKKKISSSLSMVEFFGKSIREGQATNINFDSWSNKNDVPFVFFKLIKKEYSIVVVDLSGNNDL